MMVLLLRYFSKVKTGSTLHKLTSANQRGDGEFHHEGFALPAWSRPAISSPGVDPGRVFPIHRLALADPTESALLDDDSDVTADEPVHPPDQTDDGVSDCPASRCVVFPTRL